MLTDRQKSIIKQTVPALREHGNTITEVFYKRMFEQDPLVKNYFNKAHQATGEQPKALAAAVYAYAQNIDNLAALSSAVELITQKHCSMDIRPELYPVVGRHLLAAIKEVLGDAATEEILEAWNAAYVDLANIFIQKEKEIYENQEQHFGWSGLKAFSITKIEDESTIIKSVYLEPVDGQALAPHQPGQYIGIRSSLKNGQSIVRNYSLSNKPGTPYLRISIKREDAPNGTALPHGEFSYHAHDQLNVGDTVLVSPPSGNFTYQARTNRQDKPLVFIAGGIGITPLLSMLEHALDCERVEGNTARPIHFIHAIRNTEVQAFGERLSELADTHSHLKLYWRYSDANQTAEPSDRVSYGLLDGEFLDQVIGQQDADYYFCGPNGLMMHINQLLRMRGVQDDSIHFECFGPAKDMATAA